MDVVAWLRGLGLEQYEAAFRDNAIDSVVLPSLTAEDLRDLGINLVGHRRRLLDAIAALRADTLTTAVAPALSDAPAPPDAERRQLTVMFCDLVGSTALSARLDPEDLREVIGGYHRAVATVIRRFDGFVAKYMGDGVLIYFGYPQAHEDDAERAIQAGLGVIDAVGRLDIKSIEVQARVGIATGLVVVGDLIGEGSAQEQSVVGETPNLASRLQTLAEPNTVVIAAGTRRLVGDLFVYRDLGAIEVKGIAAPVPASQVLRPSVVASRFEALHGSILTRLIGRDEEIDLLLHRWARAKTGHGQVVLVTAEAGLGKSRIVAALEERLHAEQHVRLRYYCSPYYQDSALRPFIEQLGRASGFTRDDTPVARQEKLETLLARVEPPYEDVTLLTDLMSLPCTARHPLPSLSPQRRKERTLEALIRQLEGLAREQPVLLVFEDAHWIDPTSRELLDITVERVRKLAVLLIVTFRPEFQPPWCGQPHVTLMALNRLDLSDQSALISQIAEGKALPDEVIDQITGRTDGVPLFIEELTKSVLESGLLREEQDRYVLDRPLPALAIPTTLHASLLARLDRLDSVRRVAQIGAAIGREFSYLLLRSVSRLGEYELQAALARLVASELVLQRGIPPNAVYIFKHALVQDAAHSSLLRSSRQQMHAAIVEALETHFPETIVNQSELLAQHYAEAGLHAKSVENWQRAARRSVEQSALVEAAVQIEKALTQLALMPDCNERREKELHLQADLGSIRFAVRGWAAPETGDAYTRARRLWEELGYPSQFLRVPWGQWMYHSNRGELDLGRRLAEDLIQRSQDQAQNSGLVLGHLCLGATLMVRGEFSQSRLNLVKVDSLCEPDGGRVLVREAGVHPRTMCKAFLGFVDFCLGYPDRSFALLAAAIAEAGNEQHGPSISQSLSMKAKVLSLLEDTAQLAQAAEQLFAIGVDQGFPYWRAVGSIYRGWVKVMTRGFHDRISELREGIGAFQKTGARVWMPHFQSLQAEAEAIGGHCDVALGILCEALQTSRERGENWFEAELVRRSGELLRDKEPTRAEVMFGEAIRIARRQDAKLWELRAAASLARLQRDLGRDAEARDILAPTYAWFTEGFDTQDLKEAKTLLDALA